MARKNNNAGQPNRSAQASIRAGRLAQKKRFHREEHHRNKLVLGPLSENLIANQPKGPAYGDGQVHTTVTVESELQVA